MATKLKVTIEQGSALLAVSYLFQWPKKIGEKLNFPTKEISEITDQLRALKKTLAKHSPIFNSKDRKIHFGPIEAYRKINARVDYDKLDAETKLRVTKEDLKVSYDCLDRFLETEIELTGQAKKGLYRVLLVWLHPDSSEVLVPGKQDDLAWPIAEQIPGFVEKLRSDTERDKAGEAPDEDDDEKKTEAPVAAAV